MKCPFCGKRGFVPDRCIRNADAYGSQKTSITCQFCESPVWVSLSRTVKITAVEKGEFKEDAWQVITNLHPRYVKGKSYVDY